MVNRRIVLKLGAVGAAGALLNTPSQAFKVARISPHRSLRRAIFDSRFQDSATFAQDLSNRGVVVSGIHGDVAKLWYDDLQIQLRKAATPIAGLTDRVAAFCLEELVRDVGLKMFFRVDHVIDRNGNVRHRGVGPASLLNAVHNLAPRLGFGESIARLVEHVDFDEAGDIAAQKRTGPYPPEGLTALVSWIVA